MQSLTHKQCVVGAVPPTTRTPIYTRHYARPIGALRSISSPLTERVLPGSRREHSRLVPRVAEASSPAEAVDVSVNIDNTEDPDYSVSIAGQFAKHVTSCGKGQKAFLLCIWNVYVHDTPCSTAKECIAPGMSRTPTSSNVVAAERQKSAHSPH